MLVLQIAAHTVLAEPLDARMATHWRLAASLEVEAIRGNVDVVRDMAGRLAARPVADVPAELAPALVDLQARAAVLARATTVEETISGVAALGGACAECHSRLGGGPPARPTAFPPDDGGPMVRHQAAADWMWLGLVAPSAMAWDRGARELARLAPDETVEAVATRSVGAPDTPARVALYAELASACAACHRAKAEDP